MGTISDKLMRIINTKEDIRQALISKGYDVPTSIPFKEYAKMILDLPCRVDSFPDIEGIVARYSALGLTNEQMAENPIWKDLTGNGHDLQMKNFAWKGMSGVGGYTENYDSNKWYKVASRIDATWTYKSFNVKSIKDNNFAQLFYQSQSSDTGFRVLSCTIKVSGLTDGQGIEYISNGTQPIVIMRIENDGIYHLPSFDFGAKNAYYGFRFLKLQESCNITIEQLLNIGTNTEGSNLLQVGKWSKSYSNVAIWELVFLDHDATEEELTKIKDYFVKTYPWLFPDQAWTVTGKTNEDEDRATIANITGNGNNLVLSNFGFSENSGYGSYPFGMNVWNPDYIADQPYGTVHYPNDSKSYATTVKNNATNFRIKFRLRGLPEGGSFLIRVFDMNDLNTVLKTYTYTENGIHEFVYNDPNKPARIILYNGNTISNISEFYLDIIPEYEGYLVTDGVDDKIVSSVFGMGKDFTIVGDWKFIDNKKSGTGLVKASSFYIYNTMIGLDLYINSGSVKNSLDGIKSINAACSDGRAYDRNWNEILANTGNVVGSGGPLEVSSSGGRFDRIAFKNLAIYPRILSKDDCIKAYNYLQTLKAK